MPREAPFALPVGSWGAGATGRAGLQPPSLPGGIAPRSQAQAASLREARPRWLRSAKPGSAPAQKGVRWTAPCSALRRSERLPRRRAPRAIARPPTEGSQRHSHDECLSCAPDTSAAPRRAARSARGRLEERGPPGPQSSTRDGVMAEVAVPAHHPRAAQGHMPFISAFRPAPVLYLHARCFVPGPSGSPGSPATCRPSPCPPALSKSRALPRTPASTSLRRLGAAAPAASAHPCCRPEATSPLVWVHLFAAVLKLPRLRPCLPNPSSDPRRRRRPRKPEVPSRDVARPALLLCRPS
ncbi:uncharacterized protein SOCEGT47_066150 [Sorangium cellulosum]|jgi:hypothetical protein|uniref:Uncharacterized protein n=1 Tax=Sorangium cellulosum TaxID=56 RepID=A0A4V0NEG2_SORCE|nr:uncharacterized protein SOCEGT47_066150 [Sorangium cellulosum]